MNKLTSGGSAFLMFVGLAMPMGGYNLPPLLLPVKIHIEIRAHDPLLRTRIPAITVSIFSLQSKAMTKKYFIGIDVSKHTLDAAVIIRHKGHLDPPLWKQFDNSLPGLEKMKKWLNQTGIPFTDRSIIVIENTGLYHRLLWQFCTKLTLDLCIENAA